MISSDGARREESKSVVKNVNQRASMPDQSRNALSAHTVTMSCFVLSMKAFNAHRKQNAGLHSLRLF
jgi:hypothetical protein